MDDSYSYFKYPSPLGILNIYFTARGIYDISFYDGRKRNNDHVNIRTTDYTIYKYIFEELNDYFTGKLKEFEVPIILRGTEFQIKVWKEVMKIPYGEYITYGEIAKIIGSSKAARAVGNANNCNRLPIIIPCHRVIASNGEMTGYLGGIERKKWLLNHEKKYRRRVNYG
ncbi:methylated-DNA--[protein]-cysteine S-methyltransferase [Natronospora cellulosivora (SeqCode)]